MSAQENPSQPQQPYPQSVPFPAQQYPLQQPQQPYPQQPYPQSVPVPPQQPQGYPSQYPLQQPYAPQQGYPQQPQQPPYPQQHPYPPQQPYPQQQPYPPQQPYPQPPYPPQQQPYPQPPYPQQLSAQQGYPQPQQSSLVMAPPDTKKKVHNSYVWMKLVQVALSIVLVVVVSVLPIVMSGDMKADVGTVGIGVTVSLLFMVPTLAVSALVLYLSYKHLSYEIGEKEFSLYSGVFNKKKAHVPYQRIQSVNQQASLMQRIFGICTVHIDTAGGSSNKAVVVPFLQNSEAERLRAELFARKQVVMGGSVYGTPGVTGSAAVAAAPYGQVSAYGQASAYGQVPSPGYNVLDAPAEIMGGMRGVFGGTQIDTGQVSYEYGLKNKELLLTGLSNSTGFMVVAFTIIGTIVGFVATLTGVDSRLYEWGMGIFSRAFAGQLIWFGILMLVGIVLVVWIASIIGTCFSYGGFRAARRANRVEVEYGLLQHRFQGVDVDRIQSVIIKQGFIRRLIGYGELSLGKVEARVNNEEQGQTFNLVVHPFIKMSKVPGVLAGLIPEFADVPSLLTPLPRVSLRRALIRRCVVQGSGFWLAVMVTFAYLAIRLAAPELFVRSYFPIDAIAQAAYVLCALIAVLEAVNAVMWSRHSGFAYNHRFMQVVNAGFSVTKVSFPRKKIQYAYTRSNPFQRASQVATINIRTAAGIGGTTLHLVDVREDDAEKWLDWVLPRKAVLQ